jgi:hypothetical protein
MTNTPQTQHDWTVHSINIHGIFFERWCQRIVAEAKGWTLDSVNYPVEFPPPNGPFRGKESTLDIRASRDISDHRLCLLIECKKNNPEFVDWVFFQKPPDRASKEFIVSQVENTPRTPPAQGWDTISTIRHLKSNFVVADEARETRASYRDLKNTSNKTKTSNAAIQDASYQVSLAKQAVAHEDDGICRRIGNSSSVAQLPWRKRIYFPTIVTTARLFVCEFDPKAVDPATGEIVPDKAMVTEREALVFEYPLPRHLQFAPSNVADSYKEGLVDLFTRLHILVVQSQHFPTFLETFYGQDTVPTEASPIPMPAPKSGSTQLDSPADGLQPPLTSNLCRRKNELRQR